MASAVTNILNDSQKKVIHWLEKVSVGEEFNYLDIVADTGMSQSNVSKIIHEFLQDPFTFGIVRVKNTIWRKIGPFDPKGNPNPTHINSFQIQVVKRLASNKLLVTYDSDVYVMTKLEI